MISSKKSRGASGRRQRKCLTNPKQNALSNTSVPASRGSFLLHDIIPYDVFGRSLFSFGLCCAFCHIVRQLSFKFYFNFISSPPALPPQFLSKSGEAPTSSDQSGMEGHYNLRHIMRLHFRNFFEFRFHTSYPSSSVSLIVGRGADLE